MTEKEFVKIMHDDEIKTDFGEECNVYQGLNIIRKYCPGKGIEWAEHDVIGSVSISDIVKAGITREDTIKLRTLNWMIDEYSGEGLACFV